MLSTSVPAAGCCGNMGDQSYKNKAMCHEQNKPITHDEYFLTYILYIYLIHARTRLSKVARDMLQLY